MNRTPIQWADLSWNPTRGCSRVSEGCRNCYAEKIAARFSAPRRHSDGADTETEAGAFHGFATKGGWAGKLALLPAKLHEPLSRRRWAEAFAKEHGRKPRCFVNSTSDLFHEKLGIDDIAQVWGVMVLAPWMTFVVLTKRARWMRAVLTDPSFYGHVLRSADGYRATRAGLCEVGVSDPSRFPAPWIQLGVSVENQETADERIPELLNTPAAVRVVSYEPALALVNFASIEDANVTPGYRFNGLVPGLPAGGHAFGHHGHGQRVDQVIVGGESGTNARPCDVAWIRETMVACRAAGVAVFVKQLGAKPYGAFDFGPPVVPFKTRQLRDSHGGDPAEWPEDLRVRDLPEERRVP